MAFATVLNKSSHEERLRGLIYRQQYTNAPRLGRGAGPGTRHWLNRGYPSGRAKTTSTLICCVPQDLQNDEGRADRLRCRKQDNNAGADEALNKSPYDKLYNAGGLGKGARHYRAPSV